MGLLSYEGMGLRLRTVRMPAQAAVTKGFSKTVAAYVSQSMISDHLLADINN
jgi:hypothetical protein